MVRSQPKTNSSREPIPEKSITRAGGVAQDVGPEFPVPQKNKKQKTEGGLDSAE
jgi:hypothetical protein